MACAAWVFGFLRGLPGSPAATPRRCNAAATEICFVAPAAIHSASGQVSEASALEGGRNSPAD